jgi:dynein heavy chain
VKKSASQVSLLGVQTIWTYKMEEALSRTNPKERREDLERKLKEVSQTMSDLSAMCLEDIASKLERTKIEALVTIQVHQRDLSYRLKDIYRSQPAKTIQDFDW